MNIIDKPKILNKANTPIRLTKMNVSDKDNCRSPEFIVLPAAAKALLRKTSLSREVIIEFKKDHMKVLTDVFGKIQEKSSLKFIIAYCVSSISPITLVWEPDIARNLFEKLVDRLFDGKWLTVRISDNAKKQMEAFLLAVKYELQDQFLRFTKKEPLDKYLSEFLLENGKCDCFWKFFKLVLALSHGQRFIR